MKIPAHAQKVFDGIIFDVYHWEQKMFDGTEATFEMLKRPATLQIIPTVGDKILLSYEEQPTKPPTYTFLGGRQEENEEPLPGAQREFLEETGMVSDNWELIKEYPSRSKIEWPTFLFVARNCKKVAEPKLEAGEKIEVRPVSFDEFIEIVSNETFWGSIISNDVFRMKHDSTRLEEFKKRIFP